MEVLLQKETANLYFSRHNGGTKPIGDLQVDEPRRRPCRRQLEASRTALYIHGLADTGPRRIPSLAVALAMQACSFRLCRDDILHAP